MDFDTLLAPFQFGFMREAFLVSVFVAVPAALVSCFLVVKGWALMGDAVSHAVLPGVVLAYVLGLPLVLGAFVAGITCALASGFISDRSRVKRDTAMGVVFSGMFGFGLVLYAMVETNVHLDHILFGNLLGIEPDDLWTTGIISVLVCAGIALKWRDLMMFVFDPAQVRVAGLSNGVLHYALLSAMSLTIVATLAATGLILAIGLVIAPGAIAFLLVRRFGTMLLVAVLICLVSMFAGIYLSFFIDSAPAPTIVLILTGLFLIAFTRRQMKLCLLRSLRHTSPD